MAGGGGGVNPFWVVLVFWVGVAWVFPTFPGYEWWGGGVPPPGCFSPGFFNTQARAVTGPPPPRGFHTNQSGQAQGLPLRAVFIPTIAGRHKACPYNYSYLSDSIGSRRAAFHAGHNPKTMPMPTLAKKPAAGAHSGT